MSAAAESAHHHLIDDALARRNAVVLACAQALAGANNTILIATGSIVGAMLAPDKTLATVPITVYVMGLWLGTLPIGWLARHYGRRTAFQVGTGFGFLTGLVCYFAVLQGSFLIFNVGAFLSGLYAAAHQAYRFAAADTASEAFRPKAISWVLIGGVFAAILGPADRDRHQGHVAALSVCRDLSGAGRGRDRGRADADAVEVAATTGADRGQ